MQLETGLLDHLGGVGKHLHSALCRPVLLLAIRLCVALRLLGGLGQLQVIFSLLAHPVRVGASVVPLNPDPAVISQLPNDPALTGAVLVPPLPVLATNHPAPNLHHLGQLRAS